MHWVPRNKDFRKARRADLSGIEAQTGWIGPFSGLTSGFQDLCRHSENTVGSMSYSP